MFMAVAGGGLGAGSWPGGRGEEGPLSEPWVSRSHFPATGCCPVALWVKSKVLAEAH